MSLLFIDGFDVGDGNVKWVQTNGLGSSSTTTRFGGRSWALANQIYFSTKVITPSANIFVGAAIRITSYDANSIPLTFLGDNGATAHLNLRFIATTTIGLYTGGTLLASYVHTAPFGGNWFYFELGGTIATSGGTGIVKIDGVTVINFTGNTKSGGTSTNIDTVRLAGSNSGTVLFDDLYICNSLGTTNNTFIGECRIQTLVPNAAGSSTQLTPTGSATNWQNTSDIPYNTARYNSSSTSGNRDLYGLPDLLANTTVVYGVQDVIHANKTDVGPISIKAALKSSATVYYDATQSLGTTSSVFAYMRETDPATSAAWTISNVNALEFGAEVV